MVIVGDLYGLKSSSLALLNCLEDFFSNYMGFKYSLADPEVSFKSSTEKYVNQY